MYNARFDTRDETNKVTGTITLQDLLTYYSANVALDRRQIAAVPSAVLSTQFKLADGTVTNLAGILSAINAKPVTGQAAAASDPQAVVTALAAQLAKK
jgi:hypothetical protein